MPAGDQAGRSSSSVARVSRCGDGEAGIAADPAAPDSFWLREAAERRYALRLVKERLHQASFREGVLAAYDHHCAISNLPHDHLLDAAQIVADAHELLGQPVLVHGIALSRSKIHHAAFDNHLIGIDADGRVHVSERLLMLPALRLPDLLELRRVRLQLPFTEKDGRIFSTTARCSSRA